MIRKVLQSGDPILRAKSKNVTNVDGGTTKFDKKTLGIVKDLKDTLKLQKEPEGVGLAAPQIGKNVRIFVADYKGFQRVVINPEILEIKNVTPAKSTKKKKNEILEGCLSLPYYYGPLTRDNFVSLKYLNEKGEEIIETFKDFDAQIVLHEIDHLDGILFIDRLIEEKKPLYKVENDEWEEVELI